MSREPRFEWFVVLKDIGYGFAGFITVAFFAIVVGVIIYQVVNGLTGFKKLREMVVDNANAVKRLQKMRTYLIMACVVVGISVGYEAWSIAVWFSTFSNSYNQYGFPTPQPTILERSHIYWHMIHATWWGWLYWTALVVVAVSIFSALKAIRRYFWMKVANWVSKE